MFLIKTQLPKKNELTRIKFSTLRNCCIDNDVLAYIYNYACIQKKAERVNLFPYSFLLLLQIGLFRIAKTKKKRNSFVYPVHKL